MATMAQIEDLDKQQRPVHAACIMPPAQRAQVALQAAGGTPVAALARDLGVSRKFVTGLRHRAQTALDEAFQPAALNDDQVLFHLPVTAAWLEQLVLALLLECRSSYRGVMALFETCLDSHISLGKLNDLVHSTAKTAAMLSRSRDRELLRRINEVAIDEIFQAGKPVLCGVDVDSSYCFLLRPVPRRDSATWKAELSAAGKLGLRPGQVYCDAGKGLLGAIEELALQWGDPTTAPWQRNDDHFHRLRECHAVVRLLENRAYRAIETCYTISGRMARARSRGKGKTLSRRLGHARAAEQAAIALAEDVGTLLGWLEHDVLAVTAGPHTERVELMGWLLSELAALEPQCRHRIGPLMRCLQNQSSALLAYAARLDTALLSLAEAAEAPLSLPELHALLELRAGASARPDSLQRVVDAALCRRLGAETWSALAAGLDGVLSGTTRASSLVENLNSRLRSYFFLRKQSGAGFCDLLRFFLNHRRLVRSRRSSRRQKSPAEILSGRPMCHWLEQLGYTLFRRPD